MTESYADEGRLIKNSPSSVLMKEYCMMVFEIIMNGFKHKITG
jgi:hypothetical protein